MLIVLTGKTTSGKDTVMAAVLAKFPNLKRVVSTTSRAPRKMEKNGIDYNFVSRQEFEKKIEQGEFLEHVEYGGNLYGTEKSQILENQDMIWRIDPGRAGQIRELIDIPVKVIYLTVDDFVVLERLKKRGLSAFDIEKRMAEDKKYWEQYKDNYDFVIENIPGKLDQTIDRIVKIIAHDS